MTAARGASSATAPPVPPDERTVGDLLHDADFAARELLWEAPPHMAKARVRSWGEVVEAAAGLWASIPDRTGDPSMGRIHRLALGMHRTQLRTGWPGVGEGDPLLERAVENLWLAAEMVAARRHPTAPLSEPGHLDSEAARTRIMHVVYVASHGVGQALDNYNRDLRRVLDAKHRVEPGQSAEQSRDLLVRVGTAEQLAASYLSGRWPAALTGQHLDPVEPGRLERAVARWDVQARRTLAASPTATDVLFTVKVERDLTVTGARIFTAAAHLGAIDADQHANRLQPALGSLDDAWAQLGVDLQQIAGRARRIDPDLLHAGAELRASLREITADLGGHAGPETMAQRVDLRAASREVQRGLVAAVDFGYVLREAVTDPEFFAPARGVAAACTVLFVRSDDAAWVELGDLYANRAIPIPQALRESLAERSADVVEAAVQVDSASTFLGANRDISPAGPRLNGRGHEERGIGVPPGPGPAYGCER
ncbi:hypothetical protein [Pengzhenrongella frigida]|uniref:Uncharacterized protein n=1 Tax=Pengzhenrongella frigida TaxID=1259133 RepID=A0A4Q5MZB2_9MICO|nr:hypothetical protein [Cellulomonas sp. HLT2-17]RYV50273.1 hypothetical protein EUA98_14225 [Cellulomonas sp. HLT2-17]